MALQNVGNTAPLFSLKNQDNRLISLNQYLGKWIITYFYPKAQTPGCTVQACGLKDKMSDITKAGAIVLGISPDKQAALKKFVEHDGLNFHLLSDIDHQTAEAYGVWQEKSMYGRTYMGMARVTYIINPQGKIAYIFDKVNTTTHADDVLLWLKENAQ